MPAEKPHCHDCEKATTLAGELIAMILINAIHGTWKTASHQEIDEHMKPWVARLKELRPMPLFPPRGETIRETNAKDLP